MASQSIRITRRESLRITPVNVPGAVRTNGNVVSVKPHVRMINGRPVHVAGYSYVRS